jgi:hypothetical protein
METLVYDECRHKAFCLNESSAAIWKLADGERTVGQISAAASVELKTKVNEELVLFAIEELRREGLIEPPSVIGGRAISRREILHRLGVGGAMLLPVIAAIVAPTAAQAYNGCVDCSSASAPATRTARARRQQQLQQSNSIDPITNSTQPPK